MKSQEWASVFEKPSRVNIITTESGNASWNIHEHILDTSFKISFT